VGREWVEWCSRDPKWVGREQQHQRPASATGAMPSRQRKKEGLA
jgi:hypothetical protein